MVKTVVYTHPQLATLDQIIVGQRVFFPDGYEYYPHFRAKDRAAGMIIQADKDMVGVLMDDYLEGCEEWSNVIYFHADDHSNFIDGFSALEPDDCSAREAARFYVEATNIPMQPWTELARAKAVVHALLEHINSGDHNANMDEQGDGNTFIWGYQRACLKYVLEHGGL